jgi:hypothetical protein
VFPREVLGTVNPMAPTPSVWIKFLRVAFISKGILDDNKLAKKIIIQLKKILFVIITLLL